MWSLLQGVRVWLMSSDDENSLRENVVQVLSEYVDENSDTLVFIADEIIKRAVMPEIEKLNDNWAALSYATGPH